VREGVSLPIVFVRPALGPAAMGALANLDREPHATAEAWSAVTR
jgi:hypothetical protein